MRTLAIGDIHGMTTCLDALLAAINLTPEDHLVFLGDYVDRGPDSKGVLDRLILLKKQFNVTCIMGNHEIMMRQARGGKDDLRMWCSVGGNQALASYATKPGLTATIASIPADHWHFLDEELVDYLETENTIFVHANLHYDLPLEEQSELMLQWEFLSGPIRHFSGKLVVCGHTSQKDGLPKDYDDTICIDTYACGGGWLTCLDVTGLKYWQADVLGRVRTGQLPPRMPRDDE